MSKLVAAGRRWSGRGLAVAVMCAPAHADECVRSGPSPMFAAKRSDIHAHVFRLTSSHEAVERFRLDANTQIIVEHGGCETIVAKLRFASPGLFAARYADRLAYARAAALLGRLQALRPHVGFDRALARRMLSKEAGGKRSPVLARELHARGDGEPPLEAVVQVDAAGRGRKGGYVEVTLFRGPP